MSEVKLPALGESVTEGTVTRWLKKVGDSVAIDEPLVEVSTDKVDTEIPSPVAGILQQILVAEDETAAVGAVLAIVGEVVGSDTPVEVAPPVVAAPPVVEVAPVVVAEPVLVAPVVAPAVVVAPVVAPPATEPIATPTNLPVYTPQVSTPAPTIADSSPTAGSDASYVTPLVRKLANETGVNLSTA